MKIATVPGTSATTERRHGVVHRRSSPARRKLPEGIAYDQANNQSPQPAAAPQQQAQRARKQRARKQQASPHWQDNNSQLAAGKSAAAPRGARLHASGASPNRLAGASPSPLAQKFASPGSSPPSRAHFEHGTWYQKHDGLDDAAPPVRPYPEAVAESWEQHQQAAVLYEDALQHKRRTLGNTHASTLMSVRKLAELCEIRGDIVQAEVLFAEAFAGYCRKHGDEHTDTVAAERNLARVRAKCAELGANLRSSEPPRPLTDRQLSEELSALLQATVSVAIDDVLNGAGPSNPAASATAGAAAGAAVPRRASASASQPVETWRGVEQATSVREIFREVPVGLHLDAHAQKTEETRRAAQLWEAEQQNGVLQARVRELEAALAAAQEAQRVSDRRHVWEVQDLKRKVMELAAAAAADASGGSGRDGSAAATAAATAAAAGTAGSAGVQRQPPQQQRKLLLVRQLEDAQKAHQREVALLKSKLSRYEAAGAAAAD
jgi:hypothetical protein